jgi:integrase
VNSVVPNQHSRRREAIRSIRHVFIDVDAEATSVLKAIASRRDLPPPSYVLRSSPGRAHVLWKVTAFTPDLVEVRQKDLARQLGTDPAATACDEEKRLLDTALLVMNTAPHQCVGEMLHDRIIGALELCCRRGEMLLIQNKRVNWDTCQIGIPGATAKDRENRQIPFNPKGRLSAILKRRAALGQDAYVFGSALGTHQPTIQTAWETLKLVANGLEPKAGKEGIEWNQQQLRRIDLRWHDLRHEGACRLLADGVDIRIIQLMLGHASIQQTQHYLNIPTKN